MRISDLLIKIFIVLFVCTSFGAFASDKKMVDDAKYLGFIDAETIQREALPYKALSMQLKRKGEELVAILEKRKADLEIKKKAYIEKNSILSHEASKEQTEKLNEEYGELNAMNVEYKGFMDKVYLTCMTEVGQESGKVISDIAYNVGLKVVVYKAGILYPNPVSENEGVDITQKILDGINKKMPDYRCKFEGEEKLTGYYKEHNSKKK